MPYPSEQIHQRILELYYRTKENTRSSFDIGILYISIDLWDLLVSNRNNMPYIDISRNATKEKEIIKYMGLDVILVLSPNHINVTTNVSFRSGDITLP